MTAALHLTLDTHAPVVTWGAVSGADPGATLQVAYSTTEPGIVSAELQLADRTLPMQVGALSLSVAIPVDAPGGTATVSALARDDVGNAQTCTLEIELGGVIPPVQTGFRPATGGGMPRGPLGPVELVLPSGGGRARSESRIEVTVSDTSPLAVRARYLTPSRSVAIDHSTLHTRSRAALDVALSPTMQRLAVRGGEDKILRRDGPDFEAELVALDIL